MIPDDEGRRVASNGTARKAVHSESEGSCGSEGGPPNQGLALQGKKACFRIFVPIPAPLVNVPCPAPLEILLFALCTGARGASPRGGQSSEGRKRMVVPPRLAVPSEWKLSTIRIAKQTLFTS